MRKYDPTEMTLSNEHVYELFRHLERGESHKMQGSGVTSFVRKAIKVGEFSKLLKSSDFWSYGHLSSGHLSSRHFSSGRFVLWTFCPLYVCSSGRLVIWTFFGPLHSDLKA